MEGFPAGVECGGGDFNRSLWPPHVSSGLSQLEERTLSCFIMQHCQDASSPCCGGAGGPGSRARPALQMFADCSEARAAPGWPGQPQKASQERGPQASGK